MNLIHSRPPHVRSHESNFSVMGDMVISLVPLYLMAYFFYGSRTLVLGAVSVITCTVLDFLCTFLSSRRVGILDLSPVVTGLLIPLMLPASIGFTPVIAADLFAIGVIKQPFGGLGQNFMNPALAARCFLLICFTGQMTYFVYDGVTGATPLANLKAGEAVNTMDMLLGFTRGTIGETSVIAIMIGAMFLILMGVIDLRIPGSYIVSFVVFIVLFGGHGLDAQYITAHLCGGGLMLGAWFMATDYVTSPITSSGKIIYGICMGLLTGLFRLFGGSAEGVSYAIIISNLLVPLIEKVTLPKPFGKGGEK